MSALLLVACGGAEQKAPASAPQSPPADAMKLEETEPRTIEEAQDQIARARAELGTPGLGAEASTSAPGQETKPSSTPSPAPPRTERPVDACGSSCRALASMRRAVTALCKMTGDGDSRCSDARRTLADSEAKVTSCKCS